jgi:hypothetical protein
MLTETEELEYLNLLEAEDRAKVAPIFDAWRKPARIKVAHGGRGAGAKSRSAGSLLLQFCESPDYFGESVRVICLRSVMKSIAESSWRLLKDELARLQYTGWEITQNEIRNLKNGSYIRFEGLNDMTAAQIKSLESYTIAWVEESDNVSKEAWNTLLATIRKDGSEIWTTFNRNKSRDPVYELFCINPDPSWIILACRPGKLDNPFFPQVLQDEWDRLKETDPDEALHVYEGQPRAQGERAIFSMLQARSMVDRDIEAVGAIEIGCDVARFGKDNTVAYKRHGMRVIDCKKVNGYGTVEVAGMLWDLAGKNKEIPIKVDSGYNPGVIDMLQSWGANVISIGFGEKALKDDLYPNSASEMAFTFPINEVSIPEEMMTQELFEDLTERYFVYDTAGRKRLEPKDGTSTNETGTSKQNFKGRHGGRSPDEGDALFILYYERSPQWELL